MIRNDTVTPVYEIISKTGLYLHRKHSSLEAASLRKYSFEKCQNAAQTAFENKGLFREELKQGLMWPSMALDLHVVQVGPVTFLPVLLWKTMLFQAARFVEARRIGQAGLQLTDLPAGLCLLSTGIKVVCRRTRL